MKRLSMLVAVGILVALTGISSAEVSKDEKNLERESKRLNDTAAKPDGEIAVVKRLVVDLKATEPQIQALRDRKLSYGEVASILSLAQVLPGGITDSNMQTVAALRQGPPVRGWGDVARQFGTKLGRTVSQVRKVANNANREIKTDHARAGKDSKEGPVKQNTAPQGPANQEYKGEGRLLRQGGSAN